MRIILISLFYKHRRTPHNGSINYYAEINFYIHHGIDGRLCRWFYSLFNSISVISKQSEGDYDALCAVKCHLVLDSISF